MTEGAGSRAALRSTIARTIRRAIGADALAASLREGLEAGFARLRQHAAAQIEALGRQTAESAAGTNAQLARQAETLRHEVAEEIHRHAEHLDTRFSQQLECLQQRMAMEVHRNAAVLDARIDSLLEAGSRELLAHVRKVDAGIGALDARVRDLDARLHAALAENRALQNMFFSRDALPPAVLAKQYYLQLRSAGGAMPFDDVGLSIFSQNNEDGILLHIFAKIGMASRRSIEVGCDLSGSTIGIPEGNTINLIANFAFDGLIVDIDPAKTGAIRHFFARCLTTMHLHAPSHGGKPAGYFSPALVAREVTADNINAVFGEAGFGGDIDLLSIDVDGADVAMWRAVDIVSPRVVVVEINARLPFDAVVYGGAPASRAPPDSLAHQSSRSSSLAAACEVGAEKGYVFVGMDATLLNAFFVRRDAWVEALPERTPAEYAGHRMNPLLRI